jgi:hypothetical protein
MAGMKWAKSFYFLSLYALLRHLKGLLILGVINTPFTFDNACGKPENKQLHQ